MGDTKGFGEHHVPSTEFGGTQRGARFPQVKRGRVQKGVPPDAGFRGRDCALGASLVVGGGVDGLMRALVADLKRRHREPSHLRGVSS